MTDMSSLPADQQEAVEDMIRCGFMEIGQAMHEAQVGIAELVERLQAERGDT